MQIRIINACCILHNFLLDRQGEMDAPLMNQVDNMVACARIDGHGEPNVITHVHSSNEWNNFRDTKANEMFADYQARRGLQV